MFNCFADAVNVAVTPGDVVRALVAKTGPNCEPGDPIFLNPGEYTLTATFADRASEGKATILIEAGGILNFDGSDMPTILCKNCSNKIPSPKAGQEHHPIICPECKAVFRLTEKDSILAPVGPPLRGLPSGTSVNVEGNELIITHRKLRLVHIGLSIIVFPMLIFGLFFSDLATAEFLFNPLTWMMFGLAYYALAGYVNRTVVRLNPEQLTVKHGPLPPWQNRQIRVQNISQLYVKQHVERSKKGSTTTYRLYVKGRNGQHEELASGLDSPEQALFFEQEAERYLGIKDKMIPGQYGPKTTLDFSGWQAFAQANNLHYSPGKLLEGYRVYGDYQGYQVELMAVQPRLSFSAQTRLTLTATDRTTENKDPDQPLTLNDVAALFAAPLHAGFKLAGKFKVRDEEQAFSYEQDEVETRRSRLQFIFDMLIKLVEAYPRILPLGGEVIPILQPPATGNEHPAQAVAAQLIQKIAPTTEHLHRQGEATLVCPRCIVRCATHKIELSWVTAAVYFGCRNCHQSLEFLTVDRIMAVLDNVSNSGPVQQERTLTVNWLPRQTLFDFDSVHIIRATDEDVERFAVQVGNDTDPVRQPRYKEMQCIISPGCKLSENSLRILRRTFGPIKTGS